MTNLFDKLNVLIRAGINDLLTGESHRHDASNLSSRRVPPKQLGANIEREIAALRERVNDAVGYEDRLRAAVDAARAEVDRLDQQADAAVEAGREDQARYLIEQMQRAQQRMVMAERDLSEHQLVTRELLMRVNEMDTWVAEAKRQQHEEAEAAKHAAGHSPQDETGSTASETAGIPNTLADVLRRAQEAINNMSDLIASARAGAVSHEPADRPDDAAAAPPSASTLGDRRAVEDDLDQRRQRLSKR